MLIGARLQQLALWEPEATMIVDGTGEWSRRTFVSQVEKFAAALRGLGLEAGDRVALLSPDRREYLEADYAIMAGGFVRVPLDPRLPRKDLIAMLAFTGARALVTDPAFANSVSDLVRDVDGLRHIIAFGELAGAHNYEGLLAQCPPGTVFDGDAEALASLNLSGGTTGSPKAIMLRQRNIMAAAQNIALGFDVRPDSVFLNVRPLWPVAQIILMGYLLAGAKIVLGDRFEPAGFADLVLRTGATRSSLVPTQLVRCVEHLQRDDPRLAALEVIHVGGSRVPPSIFQRALDTIGTRVGVLYGLTEAPVTCYLPPARLGAGDRDTIMESVGHALFGYRVMLDGVTASEPEATGEVLIAGDNVMAGYWQNEAATQAAFEGAWLRTGDIGRFDEHGTLFIVGRLKEVIRSGATSIVPKEVEDAILLHADVAEVAVLGVPDVEWGESIAAFVVRKPGTNVSVEAIVAHCRTLLASYKKPRYVMFVNALPRSHYGKVLRAELLSQMTLPP